MVDDGNDAPIDDEATIDNLPAQGELPEGLAGRYLRASPANTTIVSHAGRLLAREETHLPWELDADPGTVGAVDFDGRLNTPMTAHPELCPETDELLFFGYQFLRELWLTYHRLDAAGQLVQSEVIEIPSPVMMHDFAVTRNHAIFLDLPVVFALEKGGFHFDRSLGGRLGVLPRSGAAGHEIRWDEVGPCTVFGVLDAHEVGTDIVMRVCRSGPLMEGGMGDIGDQGQLWQWTIDALGGKVEGEQLDDRYGDFPRVDDRRIGLTTRYGCVGSLLQGPSPAFGSKVHKYDVQTDDVEVRDLGGPGVHIFEPVLAPAALAAPDADEDEGWVVVLSHDDATEVTTLNVLDAQYFADEPVARVPMSRRVPFGAHGTRLPA